jgi:biotin-(acetyl-CoA carboxylase) ligase
MKVLNPKWRGFFQHLGPYVIVIGMLAIINLLTSPSYPWFLFPALGWGIGLAIHFWSVVLSTMTQNLSRKWRGFLSHLGPYMIVIGCLAAINLLTSPSYPWFLWPAMGWGIGVALHLWGVLLSGDKDDREKEKVKRRVAREDAELRQYSAQHPATKGRLTNQTIQAHLDKARAYKEQINSMIRATSDKNVNVRLKDLARQVNEWAQAIEDLAWRVDRFQQNALIRQDLESVPRSIKELEARLANETNQVTRAELERTLTNRRNQLVSLKRLQSTMHRAELKIESTLSALGTIYSQILTGQSTDHVADYSRLSAEVDEEVRNLQDQLEALEEVKLSRA